MDLDFNAIKGLVEVSEKCDLSELLIEYEGVKIEIRRDRKQQGFVMTAPPKVPVEQVALPVMQAAGTPSPALEAVSDSITKEEEKYSRVLSPLVGVFYRAPWPGADPFVKVGDRVDVGQTLCIVEAMKLMNEIAAETSGKIVKILAKNEEVVQCDQPLFLIDPD